LKNIKIIYSGNIKQFLFENIWSSDIFKNLHVSPGSIVDLLIKKISDAPIFFYEMSDEKLERNNLTSFVRFIAYRKYDNPYINDLYYFHELMHLATYRREEGLSFQDWQSNMSENELLASLYSEAFIYILYPSLIGKTFENLWVKRFIDSNLQNIQPLNIKLNLNEESDQAWLDLYINDKIDFFDVNKVNWSQQMNTIIDERVKLRKTSLTDNLDITQKEIVKYNDLRERWLPKWEVYYQDINKYLNSFIYKEISVQDYLHYIRSVSNESFIPFYKVLLKQ
jgi:hypothetical protein